MSNLLDPMAEDFSAAGIPFPDVPSWAVSYVAVCYADGTTSGTSATTYGGSNTVTTAQAALNENPDNWYNFSAVIDNGRITSVVIEDLNPDNDYE